MIGIEIDIRASPPRCRRGSFGQAKRGDQAAALWAAGVVSLDGEIILVASVVPWFLSAIGAEYGTTFGDACIGRWIQRRPDMGVIISVGSAPALTVHCQTFDIAASR